MSSIRRLMFIVGQDHDPLYESLLRTFAGDESVAIVRDRRRGERRARPNVPSVEQRGRDRRHHPDVDESIRMHGYALVSLTTKP